MVTLVLGQVSNQFQCDSRRFRTFQKDQRSFRGQHRLSHEFHGAFRGFQRQAFLKGFNTFRTEGVLGDSQTIIELTQVMHVDPMNYAQADSP